MGNINRHRWTLVLVCCHAVLWLAAAGSGHADGQTPGIKGVRLFGAMEFRTVLRAVPQWTRVLAVAGEQTQRLSGCRGAACPPAAKSWQTVMREAGGLPPRAQMDAVNRFFNQWPYRLDIERFGVSDYWAAPEEFLSLSGDCEDYSIVKYFALKQLGFAGRDMRIVVVKDRIRNVGHAVLAVYIGQTAYILDNLSNLVLPHEAYRHYLPQYSVNEAHCWAHISTAENANKGNEDE